MPNKIIDKKVLVIGGAGYIGSHMVVALNQAGYHPFVLDNLTTGHRDAVLNAELIVGNLGDYHLLASLFEQHKFVAVMHFASFIEVGESVQDPIKYYQNNVAQTISLLEALVKFRIEHLIFSSTAAVYGEPKTALITESHPLAPINPYGRSKLMVEDIIKDVALAHGLTYAILRYFNASGADPEHGLTERHHPESHLIPIVLEVAAKKRDKLIVNGNDFATPDKTCVRDFIHVNDLCQAHLRALDLLLQGKGNIICNLGTGRGYSILEVINTAQAITGARIPIQFGPARAGDPAILVADATYAQCYLNWRPVLSELTTIIEHAWHQY